MLVCLNIRLDQHQALAPVLQDHQGSVMAFDITEAAVKPNSLRQHMNSVLYNAYLESRGIV